MGRTPPASCPPAPLSLGCQHHAPPVAGVHNSRLLHSYMSFDMLKRAAPLATLVKRWAKRRNINDSSRDTLSSFAYTLMVVFYLQQRGVVPNLQAPGLLRAYEGWRGKKMPAVTVHGFKLRYCADDAFLAKLAEVSGRSVPSQLGGVSACLFFCLPVGVSSLRACVPCQRGVAERVCLAGCAPVMSWTAPVRRTGKAHLPLVMHVGVSLLLCAGRAVPSGERPPVCGEPRVAARRLFHLLCQRVRLGEQRCVCTPWASAPPQGLGGWRARPHGHRGPFRGRARLVCHAWEERPAPRTGPHHARAEPRALRDDAGLVW